MRDGNEAVGHVQAYDYMLEVARSEPFAFSEDRIFQLHKRFYQGIEPEKAGVYRDHQMFISGTEYMPHKAGEVPALMKKMAETLNEQWDIPHPVRLAAFTLRMLVDIHTFADCNGRMACC